MTKILIVDDHDLVRTAIGIILKEVPDLAIVGEAASGEDAIKAARQLMPDVVLLDVNLPGISGLETMRKLLQVDPDMKIIILTIHRDGLYPQRLLETGASGYLTKDTSPEEIITAIQTVITGKPYLTRTVASYIANAHLKNKAASPFDELSDRELETATLIMNGMKPTEIAKQFCITGKTVNGYRYRIFEKLGIDSDVGLVRLGIQYNFIELESLKGNGSQTEEN